MALSDSAKQTNKAIGTIISMLNDASKERLRSIDTFADEVKLNNYQDTLIELSTIDRGDGINPFADIDQKYAEEPFPTMGGLGDTDKRVSELSLESRINLATQLSKEAEIDEVLDKFLDEMIVYEADSQYFIQPTFHELNDNDNINKQAKAELQDNINESFKEIYHKMNLNSKTLNTDIDDAYTIARKWITVGKYAWYIVFDDLSKPTKIERIVQLDLQKGSLERFERKSKDNNIIVFWVYTEFNSAAQARKRRNPRSAYRDQGAPERIIILDSQLLLTEWSETNKVTKPFSYVATLEREFNIMRTMERTRISWAIMNSIFRTVYAIPIKGKGKVRGEQTVNETMNMYRQRVEFDNQTGQYKINNKSTPRINFEMWTGETNSGKVDVSTIGGDGPDIDDVASLAYYKRNFLKVSKMPLSRFDSDQPSYWADSPQQISREENGFSKYMARIQRVYIQPIWKAVYTDLVLKHPKYIGDEDIKKCVELTFISYNVYKKMVEMELLEKTVNTIDSLRKSIGNELPNGENEPFFATKFLVNKFMFISVQELEENSKLLAEEREEKEKRINELKEKGLLDDEQDSPGRRY